MQQPITILIVDDSIIIRGIINRILSEVAQFKVVGAAIDGQNAVRMAQELQPDFVILDINMPRKDGLTALPEILQIAPNSKVIIASSITSTNAEISMKALELGASECIHMPNAKNQNAKSQDELKRFSRDLVNCIMALSGTNPTLSGTLSTQKPLPQTLKKNDISSVNPVKSNISTTQSLPIQLNNNQLNTSYSNTHHSNNLQAIAIASSTGGPHALAQLFKQLNGNIPNVPIFITQHMPPTFTSILATNIASASGVGCSEGVDGELVQPKHIYIAPGDYHMTPIKQGNNVIMRINQHQMENYCRPSADPMMRALIDIYGKNMLMIVLTGMGHDGLAGAKLLAQASGVIIAQDKASSVVWGMPKAVAEAGIANAILPLDDIANYVINAFNRNSNSAKTPNLGDVK